MNVAIVLSGGTGTRLGGSIPKQYVEVGKKPIFGYSLDLFQKFDRIDGIVFVCHRDWEEVVRSYAEKNGIAKLLAFAPSGDSRQQSVRNGLFACRGRLADTDVVLVHDAARPNASEGLLQRLLDLSGYDGVMPAVPVKDTTYYSEDGKEITSLLDRDKLRAGQAPESFLFGKYLRLHESLSEEQIARVRGSSEIAFSHGLRIKIVDGEEENYKITTPMDLEKFRAEKEEKK